MHLTRARGDLTTPSTWPRSTPRIVPCTTTPCDFWAVCIAISHTCHPIHHTHVWGVELPDIHHPVVELSGGAYVMGCGVLVWGISEPPHCVGSYPTRHVREQSRLATIPVIALCTANSVAAIRTATARDVVGCGLSGTPHHQGAVCCPHPTPRGTPDPRGRVCVCVWGRGGGVGGLPTRNAPVGARGYATPRDGSPSRHSSMGADQPRALRTTKPRAIESPPPHSWGELSDMSNPGGELSEPSGTHSELSETPHPGGQLPVPPNPGGELSDTPNQPPSYCC